MGGGGTEVPEKVWYAGSGMVLKKLTQKITSGLN
jgi:hypothetical protein